MTENYKDLRDALAAAPTDDNWICVPYSKKTLGVGVSGGPALFMVREGSYTGIDDVLEIVRNLLSVRREARALLAERDDLLENGKQAIRWAPSSAHWSNELKRLFGDDARLGIDALESQLRNAQAERDALREALIAAIECGMVPKSSVADGGASAHARQVVVADMIRAALAQHQGEKHG